MSFKLVAWLAFCTCTEEAITAVFIAALKAPGPGIPADILASEECFGPGSAFALRNDSDSQSEEQ